MELVGNEDDEAGKSNSDIRSTPLQWCEVHRFLKSNGIEIIVVNNEKLSPQEEMIQDLINIIHVFSCRIYGLRKYKKKVEEDGELCELTKLKLIQQKNKNT